MTATRLIRGSIAATALLLAAAPALAHADTRYASPSGTGPVGTCPQSDPCSANDAFAVSSVDDGDVIRLAGGSYDVGFGVDIFDQITVEPDPGTGIPKLTGSGVVLLIANEGAGSTVRDLEIVSDAAGPGSAALHVNPGGASTLERLKVIATGASDRGVQLEGTLSDSIVVLNGSGSGGAAVLPCCGSATLRNVTAIAEGDGDGIAVRTSTGPPVVTVTNTIVRARGTGADIRGVDDSGGDENTAINISNSNVTSWVGVPGEVEVNFLAGNQAGEPLFANTGELDFRQRPGSPTIDAGSAAGVGSADLEGQPRIQGPAPDIGADEAPDPSSLLTVTEKKLKRKRTLRIPVACPLYNCNLAAAANLVVKGIARRAAAARVIRLRGVQASLIAGQAGELVFRLSKKNLKRLRAAAKARLTLSATVTATLGFTGTEQASFKFKKPRR